jgi:hypothetical protein
MDPVLLGQHERQVDQMGDGVVQILAGGQLAAGGGAGGLAGGGGRSRRIVQKVGREIIG